jgi:hypothetical protein
LTSGQLDEQRDVLGRTDAGAAVQGFRWGDLYQRSSELVAGEVPIKLLLVDIHAVEPMDCGNGPNEVAAQEFARNQGGQGRMPCAQCSHAPASPSSVWTECVIEPVHESLYGAK